MADKEEPRRQPLSFESVASAVQESGASWQPAYTSMMALDEDERVVRLGVPARPELEEHSATFAAMAHASAADAIGAPASFDVRNVDGVSYDTDVKDQGGCGSCVAFGVAATMEVVFRYTHRTTLPVDVSEAHLFYVHGRGEGRNCGNGWWPDRALTHAQATGVTFEDYYPYTAGDQDGSALNGDWPNRLVRAVEWADITNDALAMKERISAYGAVTACLNVFDDFFSYRSGVYRHVTGDLAGGHCVVLIGYDDAEGAWIGRNSWGAGWGDGGYFRIGYGECGIESFQTCSVQSVSVRAWLPDQAIAGLWSNEADANVWAYGAQRGWLKLDGADPVTNHGMLTELAAAKALARPVGLFEDNGSVKQIYAW